MYLKLLNTTFPLACGGIALGPNKLCLPLPCCAVHKNFFFPEGGGGGGVIYLAPKVSLHKLRERLCSEASDTYTYTIKNKGLQCMQLTKCRY